MIDRLAKAAEEAAKKGGGYFYEAVADDGELILGVDGPVDMREVVRTVLREMREPSDAAIDGAIGVMAKLQKPPESAPAQAQLSFVRALAVTINSGMIDTILNEKTDDGD